MNGAFEVGAVALRAQQQALETHANNVANVNTPGFKRSEVHFSSVVTANPPSTTETERLAREANVQGGGIRATSHQMLSDQGELQATGAALDVAIDGNGYFELLGPDGESLLWRGGRLAVDRDGYLAAEGAGTLRSLIAVPDDATSLIIANAGAVTAILADGDNVDLGQISLVKPGSEAELSEVGAGQYRLVDGGRLLDGTAGEDGMGIIQQGMIELSNVEMASAMVDMLVLQRAYAASAQVLQTADQIASITNNLKR